MKVSVSTLGHVNSNAEERLDSKLSTLRDELDALALTLVKQQQQEGEEQHQLLDQIKLEHVQSVVKVIEEFSTFRFVGVEQINLYSWITVLDLIDATMHYLLHCLVVLENGVLVEVKFGASERESLYGIQLPMLSTKPMVSCEYDYEHGLLVILEFLSEFLRCSIHKHVFNLVEIPLILLMAKSDALHSAALKTLYSISLPPIITDLTMGHQQQHGNTQLHAIVGTNNTSGNALVISEILLGLSRGWGTEGGLMSEVSVDDAGQRMGQLGDHDGGKDSIGGTISLEFWNKTSQPSSSNTQQYRQQLIQLKVSPKDIDSIFPSSTNPPTTSKLYMHCLDVIKKQSNITVDDISLKNLASLIHSIRLALAYRRHTTRIKATERRLQALVVSICTHRSMDILSGYFIAQPELVGELVSLVKLNHTSNDFQISNGATRSIITDGIYQSLSDHIFHSGVPFEVRKLAITALTVLITRRNSTEHNGGGTLSSVAKQTNVLSELGVGKGRYLGLLPTLLRFSLTSLVDTSSSSLALSGGRTKLAKDAPIKIEQDDTDIAMGLIFLEATKPTPPPPQEAEELALEFIDYMLNLTIAVVNVSSGSAALTDCGLIPTLIGVIGSDLGITCQDGDNDYIKALRKSVVSQAVQILDTAIVTHGSAFAALNELDGSNILLQRLDREVQHIIDTSSSEDVRQVDASVRVLLYNLMNCITVIFHQSDTIAHTNAATNTTVGSTLLRSKKLTNATLEFLRYPVEYGGLLLALTGTMLADVMNSDPTVVHHVHSSGIAQAYFDVLKSNNLPTSSEFIMGIPSMLGALALTSSGADTLSKQDPFQQLISTVFVSSKYCMPQSKCLLNGITAMFGTGLDELIRHIPQVKNMCVKGLAHAVKEVTILGEDLIKQERSQDRNNIALLHQRTHFIQYVQNVCQILSHILHTSENVGPFIESGGWQTLLHLHSYLLPQNSHQFLSHITCLSNLSLSAHLGHFGASTALTVACKNVLSNASGGSLNSSSQEFSKLMFNSLLEQLEKSISHVARLQVSVRSQDTDTKMDDLSSEISGESDLDLRDILRDVPKLPLHRLSSFDPSYNSLADFLRSIAHTEWLIKMLECVLRHFSTAGNDIFSVSSSTYSERALQSDIFKRTLDKLGGIYSNCMLETSSVRTEQGYDEREKQRLQDTDKNNYWHPSTYVLRVVCQDGAIVRDGIEIDLCQSVGNLEMGEIITATDRCVNASGVMRYKLCPTGHSGNSSRWVSELTRGHGREPIAEVIQIMSSPNRVNKKGNIQSEEDGHRRINVGVLDLRSASASVLGRIQGAHKGVVSALSKLLMQNRSVTRSLWGTSLDAVNATANSYEICNMICKNLDYCLGSFSLSKKSETEPSGVVTAEEALYMSGVVDILLSCLFEEKRDRKSVNSFLLVGLLNSSQLLNVTIGDLPFSGFWKAVRATFDFALKTLSKESELPLDSITFQPINRVVAASFVPSLSLIHKLTTHRMANNLKSIFQKYDNATTLFPTTTDFVRYLHGLLGNFCLEICKDERLVCLPAHILHPLLGFMSDVMASLKASSQSLVEASAPTSRKRAAAVAVNGSASQALRRISVPGMPVSIGELPDLHRRLAMGTNNVPGGVNIFLGGNGRSAEPFQISFGNNNRTVDPFEPSEEAITQLMEMGFSRDHALEALEETGSNQVEVAMEYALTHPPPSPATAERRRIRREARAAAAAVARLRSRRETEERNSQNEEVSESQDNVSLLDTAESEQESSRLGGVGDNGTKPKPNLDIEEDAQHPQRKELHDSLYAQVSKMIFFLVEGVWGEFQRRTDDSDFSGQKEGEGIVVVLASFFLDKIAKSYPEGVSRFFWDLLSRLHSHFKASKIIPNHEVQVASLCHFLTITLRALPLMRQLVLRKGLCSTLVKSLKHASEKNTLGGATPWIPNVLLLLGLLAQPTPSPMSNLIVVKDVEFGTEGKKSEYQRCCGEHKRQAALLDKVTVDMCAIIHGGKAVKKSEQEDKKMTSEENELEKSSIPTYVPTLPLDELEMCVHVCFKMLSKIKESKFDENIDENPGIIHSILLLLLRVIRCHKLAMTFLRMGGCELILSLPPSYNFVGKTGLITAILVRLLEDEHTLRQSIEAEIRSTVTRLHMLLKKQSRTIAAGNEVIKISSKSFIQAVAPLICRDPVIFLKAAATSIATQSGLPGSTSSVTLLSTEERACNTKALASYFGASNGSHVSCITNSRGNNKHNQHKSESKNRLEVISSSSKRKHSSKEVTDRKKKKAESKSPKKLKKSGKEDSKDSIVKSSFVVLNGTPANHITSLLLTNLVLTAKTELNNDSVNGDTFLLLVDYLDILADLVLAVPACAAAIHRYRALSSSVAGHTLSNMHHAIHDSLSPPGTAVGFLLHYLLPMIRVAPSKHAQRTRENESELLKEKRDAYFQVQVAQKSARLLVILCARAGEGRRRVVADLAAALGAESKNDTIISNKDLATTEKELWALRSWGELCIGLSAPRSSGVNQDSDNTLSWEVVRLMLEFDIPRTLLKGIDRVDLKAPLAPDTIAAMLRPLEVFTRGSVSDTVEEMVRVQAEKEEALKTMSTCKDSSNTGEDVKAKSKDSNRRITFGPSQRSEESFSEDAMLGDGFMPEDADRVRRSAQRRMIDDIVDLHDYENDEELEIDIESNEEHDEDESETDESENMHLEVRLGNPDELDGDESESERGDEDDGNDDLVSESDDNLSVESDSSNSDIEMMDDTMDEVDDIDESIGDDDVEEDENDEGSWDDYDEEDEDFFDDVPEDREEGIGMPSESELDDGWTRIDSGGVPVDRGGGVFFLRQQGADNDRLRADDAMGGVNVLRNILNGNSIGGPNDADALAEIEETLGIRLQNRGSGTRRIAGAGLLSTGEDDVLGGIGGLLGGLVNIVNSNNSTSATTANSQNELGMRPIVTQSEFSLQTVSGGGFSKGGQFSSIDYVYGGISDMFALHARQPSLNAKEPPVPTTYDVQLFPLGPAAATHSKSRQYLHPLLCDLNLPPPNTIISTMESHGERSNDFRRVDTTAQTNSATRASNFSVRLNRGTDGIPFIEHTSLLGARNSGLAGGSSRWLDDGQPLDNTTLSFTESFERALSVNMTRNLAEQAQRNSASSEQRSEEDNGNTVGVTEDNQEQEEDEAMTLSMQNSSLNTSDIQLVQVANSNENQDETVSDGEAVVSTLAAELTLASRSDSSASMDEGNVPNNDQTEPRNTEDIQERPTQDQSTINHSNNTSVQEEEQVSEMDIDNIATSNSRANEESDEASNHGNSTSETNENDLVCPPGMDLEVFNCLPTEMQQEVVEEHRSMAALASQIDASSGLDPEALAALPDDMRREIIAQQEHNRTQRPEAPADPSNAEDMDNASFLASLAPDLRADILITADNDFLSSLPPSIVAEAQVLRDRAASRHQAPPNPNNVTAPVPAVSNATETQAQRTEERNVADRTVQQEVVNASASPRNSRSDRRNRSGHIRVDRDRLGVVYQFSHKNSEGPFDNPSSLATLVKLLYMLSPVRPNRLLQKLFANLCANLELRKNLLTLLMSLLQGNTNTARSVVNIFETDNETNDYIFPPTTLIGTAPDTDSSEESSSKPFHRRNINVTAVSIAANIPSSSRTASHDLLPSIVARRIIECLSVLSKNGRIALEVLESSVNTDTHGPERHARSLDCLVDLLCVSHYTKSSTNLEQLLHLIEIIVNVLSVLPKADEEEQKILKSNISSAASMGKEWVRLPRPVVAQHHIKLLCSVLRLETCKDTSFHRINQIVRRLCRIEENRVTTLRELAFVAQGLGIDATRDLKSLNISLTETVETQKDQAIDMEDDNDTKKTKILPASAVTLSTSSSELKLLRVLQTLHSLCDDVDDSSRKIGQIKAASCDELSALFKNVDFESLWGELAICLKVVSVLQGVTTEESDDDGGVKDNENLEQDNVVDDIEGISKKLPASVAGLLSRFLPAIEAFFVVNASQIGMEVKSRMGDSATEIVTGAERLVKFVGSNKILLNALIRANPSLLEKGLKSMVQVPQCRPFIDFDVKRHWFKSQMRRLRQSASRRHGSLRMNIRRKNVFEDAYYQLHLRTGEEMRGRLHITFSDEEGVDAGGLSREFFEILSKEMFNPNYALFTSTEDGCTFQPNPNSSFVNPDHLSHFRFVGRIVGKALADGFLLDAHFTRSLYKHMLGVKPTHHDMEAIDPDFYKNLKMILEYNLADIGLDHLTFSTEDNSFGRSRVIDLIPGGRSIAVTEENKEQYVSEICQYRMTTSIEPQIKAYLEGFYEMIKKDFISIFTAKELELLISGLPDIDIFDLQKNTEYTNYKPTDTEIMWFWEVMHDLSRSEKAAFLQFVTGSAKVPLEGFSQLQGMRGTQKFSITKASGSTRSLMSAHTCFNALELPVYDNKEVLREKLLYAIAEGQGSFQFA